MAKTTIKEPTVIKSNHDNQSYTLARAQHCLNGWLNTPIYFRDREENIRIFKNLVMSIEKKENKK